MLSPEETTTGIPNGSPEQLLMQVAGHDSGTLQGSLTSTAMVLQRRLPGLPLPLGNFKCIHVNGGNL